jgi:predicted DNA-binding protein with PD1-like motif
MHLHISISDSTGKTFGGHLCETDNIVHTTAEIVLGEMPSLIFEKEKDEISGWNELKIKKNNEK